MTQEVKGKEDRLCELMSGAGEEQRKEFFLWELESLAVVGA